MRNMSKRSRRFWLTLFCVICAIWAFDDMAGRYYRLSDQYDRSLRGWDATFAAWKYFLTSNGIVILLVFAGVAALFAVIALVVRHKTRGQDTEHVGAWLPKAPATAESHERRADIIELRRLPPPLQQWVDTAVGKISSPMEQDKARIQLAQQAQDMLAELEPVWGDRAAEQALLRLGDAETVAQRYLREQKREKPGTWKYYAVLATVTGLVTAVCLVLGVGYMLPVVMGDTQHVNWYDTAYQIQGAYWLVIFFGLPISLLAAHTAVKSYRTERAERSDREQ